MEKVDLKYVRTFHLEWPHEIDGTAEGDVEYALTRSDWATAAMSYLGSQPSR